MESLMKLFALSRFDLMFDSGADSTYEASNTEILRRMQELAAANDSDPMEKVA